MAPEKCLKPHVHTGPTALNVGVPVTQGCVSCPTGSAMKQGHFLLVLWAANKVSAAAGVRTSSVPCLSRCVCMEGLHCGASISEDATDGLPLGVGGSGSGDPPALGQ